MTRKVETNLVQLGNKSDYRTGAVNPPIHLSTAYQHEYLGHSTGYDYTRTVNPTREILEKGVAQLESGDKGFACSSGMAAIQLVLSLFRSGDELILEEDIYGGTYRLLEQYEEDYGVVSTYSSFIDLPTLEEKITKKTKGFFIETITNPLMQEIDVAAVAKLAEKYNILLIVDNTFLTPYFHRPIELGADIVIHSATKYIGGHNDVLAGLVIAKGDLCDKLAHKHNSIGAVLSPIDSWLVIRGLKTLHLRMDRHQSNAKVIADYLAKQSSVTEVLYPGKGGMLSFRLKDRSMVNLFLENIKLISFAESLGGVESFITYPTTQTHGDIPVEERNRRGVCDKLLRFSVGIENTVDLINDLNEVFLIINENT